MTPSSGGHRLSGGASAPGLTGRQHAGQDRNCHTNTYLVVGRQQRRVLT